MGEPCGSEEWTTHALLAVSVVVLEMETFTADDVWKKLGQEPTDEAAMSAVLRTAERKGYCTATLQKVGPTRLWKSERFRG